MALEAKANSQNIPKGMRRINPVNWFKGTIDFIKDSKNELKRITWPEKSKIIRTTTVVLTTIIFLTIVIWLIDSIFNFGLSTFIKVLR